MNGNKLIYSIITALSVAAIIGGIQLAVGQGRLETRQDAQAAVQASQQETVQSVPVIANEISHIKGDIADIKAGQKEIFNAIKALTPK
jgi:hypothetical protein